MIEDVEIISTQDSKVPCLTVQSDYTVLLERHAPSYSEARDFLIPFAELEKCPEHIHTYRITPLTLWNAAALGFTADYICDGLKSFTRYTISASVIAWIKEQMSLWGKVKLVTEEIVEIGSDGVTKEDKTILEVHDPRLLKVITSIADLRKLLKELPSRDDTISRFSVPLDSRGPIKIILIELNIPVEDCAGYTEGDFLEINLHCQLREYQSQSVHHFYANRSLSGGSGVIVLPCGAGKTVVALGVMAKISSKTLILCSGATAAKQWKRELLDKTNLTADQIGEYHGLEKEIAPVTIATYQILTRSPKGLKTYPHFDIFNKENWGLIIYDEVHQLPAPVFQITANIQSRRRLGLTATLIREDGKEADVFSLIGPKRMDVPWKVLETQGWIANASCTEIRTRLSELDYSVYSSLPKKDQFAFASSSKDKLHAVKSLLDLHKNDNVLIIGLYLQQLELLAKELDLPIIQGNTKLKDREILYSKFRSGEISKLIVSKVANVAIDLPDASVAIQVSGTFGSRQEEAQRLGRILRPKKNNNKAHFYSIVAQDTSEVEFAMNRQLFLLEQGYEYRIISQETIEADYLSGDRLELNL